MDHFPPTYFCWKSHFTRVDPRGYFQPHVLMFCDSFWLDSLLPEIAFLSCCEQCRTKSDSVAKSNLNIQVCEELLDSASSGGPIFRAVICNFCLLPPLEGQRRGQKESYWKVISKNYLKINLSSY